MTLMQSVEDDVRNVVTAAPTIIDASTSKASRSATGSAHTRIAGQHVRRGGCMHVAGDRRVRDDARVRAPKILGASAPWRPVGGVLAVRRWARGLGERTARFARDEANHRALSAGT